MVNGQALASEDINLTHSLSQQVGGLPTIVLLEKSGLNAILHMGLQGAIPKELPILGAETRVFELKSGIYQKSLLDPRVFRKTLGSLCQVIVGF